MNDCGAKALFTSVYMASVAEPLAAPISDCPIRLVIDGDCAGYQALDSIIESFPTTPLTEEPRGQVMLYSSGDGAAEVGYEHSAPYPVQQPVIANALDAELGHNRLALLTANMYGESNPGRLRDAAKCG